MPFPNLQSTICNLQSFFPNLRSALCTLPSFFHLAAVSPGRQRTFRYVVSAHLLVLAGCVVGMRWQGPVPPAVLLGNVLLIAGIVEGALLIGWRLAQLPKSQALEFLLVSPLRPPLVLAAEAAVGLGRLALATLAGLPVLGLMVIEGVVLPDDLGTLLFMPFTWGAVTGLGLTVWAYEPAGVRRWGERLMVLAVVFYLVIGILAGEHLREWLAVLPSGVGESFFDMFDAMHRYNPFSVIRYAMEQDPAWARDQVLWLEAGGLVLLALLLARAARRLQGHFQDRHYRPVVDERGGNRGTIGAWPLSWWCVRRVTEYSGRINLWLAGGFGVLYAAYTLAGPAWPPWLGHAVFQVFDRLGGIPVLATALVVLAAVPAAFQYGLWDSNAQDRCRRLELLLLTGLEARDYWHAATAAAWRRGRGYFAVAALLWLAEGISGAASFSQVLAGFCAGVILWGLYFALGFRAFSRGLQASALGMFLTLGLPLLAFALYQAGWPGVAALLPPGSVYQPSTGQPSWTWPAGPLLGATAALAVTRWGFAHCLEDLRRWYNRHHGQRVLDAG
jgi:hypothetical protein